MLGTGAVGPSSLGALAELDELDELREALRLIQSGTDVELGEELELADALDRLAPDERCGGAALDDGLGPPVSGAPDARRSWSIQS